MIDSSKIPAPSIEFSKNALTQLNLIFEHDPTVEGKQVRLTVSGKGCDGFNYTLFPDIQKQDDKIVFESKNFNVIMDPFTSFYLQNGSVDFVSPSNHQPEEGFVIVNHDQKNFQGKFWKRKEELVPPTV